VIRLVIDILLFFLLVRCRDPFPLPFGSCFNTCSPFSDLRCTPIFFLQGSISQKQKRVLLTDIITCSAKGEFSMVEVAYELLCGEGDDKDAAEEEFADQCRVFATDIPQRSAEP